MTWTATEFAEAGFNDERLNKRFQILVECLSQRAGESIPLACEDWSAAKAAYRFFDNPKVSQEKIIQSHIEATSRRSARLLLTENETLLIIQDTTYFNYAHRPKMQGLGEVSKFTVQHGQEFKSSGLILHSALPLSTDGVPLGILNQKLWTRTKPTGHVTQSGKNITRIPIEEKESFRWIEAMRNVSGMIENRSRVVHVGDRESDIFELFEESARQGTHFLIRIRDHQRCTEDGGRIFDKIRTTRSKGKYKIRVKSKDGERRVAKIEVKFYPVTVLPSVAKKGLSPVSAWVISAIEKSPPKGEEKIDWKLLTDIPTDSFDDAIKKIGWYTLRWQIEVYHKILKSGCHVLECRLQTAARLLRYIALMTVVAWRIFWMTIVSRDSPSLKPQAVLTDEEVKAIRLYNKKKAKKITANANDCIRALANLGGFLGRAGDGHPGPFVLWKGYLRLQDIMIGLSLGPP
jgi:hypothetical protein